MKRICISRLCQPRAVLIAIASCLVFMVGIAHAQDVKATVQIAAAGQSPMSMAYWATGDGIRIDIAQPQEVSIVWTSGASPTMLMIQHAERRYMEVGAEQLQLMQQMMQRMPNAGGGSDDSKINVDDLIFEPTLERETIGDWTAMGVRVSGPEGEDSKVWIAADLDIGLFELFARMGDVLEAMQMPMMGGAGPQDQLTRYLEMRNATGLPDGGVVRMDMNDENGATNITLQALDQGSFPDALAPEPGYQKMQMPNFPGSSPGAGTRLNP